MNSSLRIFAVIAVTLLCGIGRVHGEDKNDATAKFWVLEKDKAVTLSPSAVKGLIKILETKPEERPNKDHDLPIAFFEVNGETYELFGVTLKKKGIPNDRIWKNEVLTQFFTELNKRKFPYDATLLKIFESEKQ